jgi:pimeloyl-[acyl-carrier protein] methyl ester esterase
MTGPEVVMIPGWGATGDAWARVTACAGMEKLPIRHVCWSECLGAGENIFRGGGVKILVGWSLGGLLAMKAAIERPAGIAGMVLVSSTARLPEDRDYAGVAPKFLRAMIRRLGKDRDGVLADFLALCASPDRPPEEEWLADCPFGVEILREGLDALAISDLREKAPVIECPVRILHGDADAVIPFSQARELSGKIASASLRRLAGCGHALPYSSAQEIAETIIKLYREIGAVD